MLIIIVLFVSGAPGLMDPCEKDKVDASHLLSPQQREDLTFSAQVILHLIYSTLCLMEPAVNLIGSKFNRIYKTELHFFDSKVTPLNGLYCIMFCPNNDEISSSMR